MQRITGNSSKDLCRFYYLKLLRGISSFRLTIREAICLRKHGSLLVVILMLRYFCNLAGVELRNSALFMIDETKINEHKVFEKCKQSMTVETFTE